MRADSGLQSAQTTFDTCNGTCAASVGGGLSTGADVGIATAAVLVLQLVSWGHPTGSTEHEAWLLVPLHAVHPAAAVPRRAELLLKCRVFLHCCGGQVVQGHVALMLLGN